MLAYLEARFKKMLEWQIEVYEGTLLLDRIPRDADNNQWTREDDIQSGRLSRKESTIVLECDKALTLLREEGSAVAMTEAVIQVREDMEQVVVRLAQSKVDEVTQRIEEDIITALEEIIAALQKAQRDLEQQQQPPGQPGPTGQPQDPPLIDMLAELKMLKSLQLRVNKRTQFYAELIKAVTGEDDEVGQAREEDLREALRQLAEREQRIYDATRDIVTGKNR